VNLPVIFVGLCRVEDDPAYRLRDLCPGRLGGCSGQYLEALGELGATRLQILGRIIEYLCAGVTARRGPAPGLLRRFDRVADVLAVAKPGVADGLPDRSRAVARRR
jgi:hypothetical protein